MATFFFCGIGGIGMSAIALYLKKTGHIVLGSDRSFDQNQNIKMKKYLEQAGIILFPQNGTSISPYINTFVVSTAVETHIPDVQKAKELQLNIKTRAQILAEIFDKYFGIAIAGTSGKTTTTAMVGHILFETQHHPVMINGGISQNTYNNNPPSNLLLDGDEICVIEADESDGSINQYTPDIAVLTNISLDHKPLDEIKPLFYNFLNRARKGIVLNADDRNSMDLHVDHPNIITFSVSGNENATLKAADISQQGTAISFNLNGMPTTLPFIGIHNLENALAAIGTCLHLGISISESVSALQTFLGVQRRLTLIGKPNDICIFDDYAHNPAKLKAALNSVRSFSKRIFAVYQPHGFGPLRLMKDELIQTLSNVLDDQIEWIMLPVFYAGGTTQKDISSADIIAPLQQQGKRAVEIKTRDEVLAYLKKRTCPGDTVLVMGARDSSLTTFAQQISGKLQEV